MERGRGDGEICICQIFILIQTGGNETSKMYYLSYFKMGASQSKIGLYFPNFFILFSNLTILRILLGFKGTVCIPK